MKLTGSLRDWRVVESKDKGSLGADVKYSLNLVVVQYPISGFSVKFQYLIIDLIDDVPIQ